MLFRSANKVVFKNNNLNYQTQIGNPEFITFKNNITGTSNGTGVIVKTANNVAFFVSAEATSTWNVSPTSATLSIIGQTSAQNNVIQYYEHYTGNAASAGASSLVLNLMADGANNCTNAQLTGEPIKIVTGTGVGQSGTITAYNPATRTATVTPSWSTVPDTTSVFNLNFNIAYANSVVYTNKSSFPAQIYGTANINPESRANNAINGATQLENPTAPELLFPIGNPYVANLSSTTYSTQQLWRNVSFTSTGVGSTVSSTLTYSGDYSGVIRHIGTPSSTLSTSLVKQNFVIVVTAVGAGCTLNVGDNVPWTTTGRTVVLSSDASQATLQATDVGGTFTADILVSVYAVNADNQNHLLKTKTLITGNTSVISSSNTQVGTYTFVDNTSTTSKGQVFIQNGGLVTPGQKQSLYLADVKQIQLIIDTGSPSILPTASMLVAGSQYDVTSHYSFDNGQRDGYYDHAGITLKPGYPQPSGNILVVLNYYQHNGGDGYFSIQSYTNDLYQQIPQYTSRAGTVYALRDCLDFRPARLNARSEEHTSELQSH